MLPHEIQADAVEAAREWSAEQRTAAMALNNRRLIAQRTGWPAHALQACLDVETKRPGWQVWWAPESTTPGFAFPAGFHANTGNHWSEYQRVFDETPHGLLPKIDASEPPGYH